MIMKNQHFGGTRHISRNQHSSQETNTLFIVCFFENSRVQVPKPCCHEWHDVLEVFCGKSPGGFFGEDFDAWAIRKTCQLKEGKFRVQYLRPRSAILHHPLEKIPLKESNQLTISGPVSPTVYTKETLSKMAKMRQAHPKKNCVSNYEETLYPQLLPSKKKNFRMKKGCFSYLPRLHESFALPIHIWLVVVSQAI